VQLLIFGDDSYNTWPAVFSTWCTGSCGSMGWRVRNSLIDSGSHAFDNDIPVDSYLALNLSLVQDGYISFLFGIPSAGGADKSFQFYVDSVPMNFDIGRAQFPLTMGHHHVMWNYHQGEGTTRDAVVLSDIRVFGIVNGGGYSQICNSGSYSNALGSEECTLCPPGQFATAMGSTSCTNCDMNTIAPTWGTAQCIPCGNGTLTSDVGATYCTSDCVFGVASGAQYSLVGANSAQVQTSGQNFIIHLCDGMGNNCTNTITSQSSLTHVCAIDGTNSGTDWGNFLTFSLLDDNEANGFTLTYTNGAADEECPDGKSTSFNLICADTTSTKPTYLNDGVACTATFVWTTINGCPVCTDDDYSRIQGDCVNGKSTFIGKRITLCNGPATRNEGEADCSQAVTFPVFILIIIGVAIAVIIIAAVVFYVQGRRDRKRYRLLLDQHSQVEMDENKKPVTSGVELDDHPTFTIGEEDDKK